MKKSIFEHYRDAILVLSICQLIFILMCSWSIYLQLNGMSTYMNFNLLDTQKLSVSLVLGSSALSVALVFISYQLLKLHNIEKELIVSRVNNELSQNTIQILRSQRHDFLNHLQVLMGYIQLGKNESAVNYMKSINSELVEIRAISGLEMPEIAVLLFSKKEEAHKHGISLNYHIQHNLSQVGISQPDMVRILSNLIDNAIYELKNLPVKNIEKAITVSFDTVGDTFFARVTNYPGAGIKDTRIFEYGFTTKGQEGSGIGLFNVKKLVETKYHGQVQVNYDRDTGTSFTVVVQC